MLSRPQFRDELVIRFVVLSGFVHLLVDLALAVFERIDFGIDLFDAAGRRRTQLCVSLVDHRSVIVVVGRQWMGLGQLARKLFSPLRIAGIDVFLLETCEHLWRETTWVDQRDFDLTEILIHLGQYPEIIHRTGHRGASRETCRHRGPPQLARFKGIGGAEAGLGLGDRLSILEELHRRSVQLGPDDGPCSRGDLAAATFCLRVTRVASQHQLTTGDRQ